MPLGLRRQSAGGGTAPAPPAAAGPGRRGGGCLSKILITVSVVLAGIGVWLGVMIQTAPTRPPSGIRAGEEALTESSPRVIDTAS